MKIGSMFEKDINRPINGVIKVMQTDDENKKQELEEYVITRELQKHFAAFYDHYQEGIDGNTDKMGVWISGFFGSGKSHFLKILSYLLQNDTVEGKKAIDYFAEKFDYDPYLYSLMKRISETPTESILFNIDAKSPMGKDQDAILRVFTKVFYEHCGYYGDDMKVASFERFLDKQGKLKEFQKAFKRINGETWESTREAFAFWEEDIVSALTEVTGISEQAARNWFNGEETAEISIDKLAREIKEYVDSKEPNFHLVFLVDEIGQYIGDNSSLMLNLQTVVEELGSKSNGKVWVIVTSQEDIDSITHVKGNDFSKIQGRFNTRLSLSSSSVDEVIKRRLLAKTPEAESLLKLMYQQNAASMRSIFTFTQDTVSDLKGYSSEDDYVTAYPFVPYQFKLMQDALVQIRKHGSSGKHLSSGARSMLSSYQEVAQKVQEYDEKSFVPFYRFFDTVYSFLDGAMVKKIKAYAKKNKGESGFNLHMCFFGNPGTGKTEVARIISRILYDAGVLAEAKIVETDAHGLLGQYVGQTAPKTLEKINEAMNGVLFIDEAYGLVSSGTSSGGVTSYGEEAIAVLLKEMEDHRGQFCVILAGYREEMKTMISANPGLESRIQFTLEFPDYTREELGEIAVSFLKKKKYQINDDALNRLLDITEYFSNQDNFANARTVRNILDQVVMNQNLRTEDEKDNQTIIIDDVEDYLTDEGIDLKKPAEKKRTIGFA